MSDLRKAAEDALEALKAGTDVDPIFAGETIDDLCAALAQPEPWVFVPIARVDCVSEAGFLKVEYFTHPPQREPLTEEDDADAIIIQYHEATIKRLEKEIDALRAVLKQALDECVWPSMRVSDVYTKATAAMKEEKR